MRWWGVENIREQLFIGTWPAGATVQEQVHRKALGVELGLSAALSSHDLRGWAIIQQNDAQPVVTALRKGWAGRRCDALPGAVSSRPRTPRGLKHQ